MLFTHVTIISTWTLGHQYLFVFLLQPNNVREKTLWECWLIWSECVSVSNIAILPPLVSHYSMMDYAGRSHKMRRQLDAITRDQDVILFFRGNSKKKLLFCRLISGIRFPCYTPNKHLRNFGNNHSLLNCVEAFNLVWNIQFVVLLSFMLKLLDDCK